METFRTLRAARCAALFAVLASATAMAIEEPRFEVLEQQGSFELREYPAYVVAETRVEAGFASAGNIAFQRLFKYISGNNVAQQEIAMTAPVTQSRSESRGEKIAMTTPVIQQTEKPGGTTGGYRVAFIMPATYTRDTVPEPLDPTVRIVATPARLMASLRFSGWMSEELHQKKERALRAELATRKLAVSGEPITAQYDAPFVPGPFRRNEVLIPVSRDQ